MTAQSRASSEPSISIRVPLLRVADVVDGDVVVLAPEERHGVEALAPAEDVARRRLALAFGDHPVLDADPIARVRIGPARDVAGGEDAGRAGLEVLVDGDAAVDREAGLSRPASIAGRTPTPRTTKSASSVVPSLSVTVRPSTRRDRLAQVEHDAVRLVELPDEAADLRPHDALQRRAVGRDDVDLDAARAQRRGDLQADEAGADDDHARRRCRAWATIARLSANERR